MRGSTASPGECAVWFPIVGVAVGLAGAWLPPLAAVFVWVLLTGGLHEDGLADCADAFRAGRTRERILAILKDSRIGSYGALALIFSILIRWQALDHLTIEPWKAIIASHAISRTAMVALAYVSPPAGNGLGKEFSRSLTAGIAIFVSLQAALASIFVPFAFPIAALSVLIAHRYFMRRIAGVTGDCLGATCQVVESLILVTATL